MFKKDGFVNGKSSIDRNFTSEGLHEWCRYTNSRGDVIIIDPAQRYLGNLKGAPEKNRWAYERPEDF
ncbi:MAG: hypothetical protein V1850_00680 [Candidatus Bathyarchaeota archaeon]